ncbi:hypothetical protein T484DRAFT_1877564, partial [Baffinella frigidus]
MMAQEEPVKGEGESPARRWSTLSVATLLILAALFAILLACFCAVDAGFFAVSADAAAATRIPWLIDSLSFQPTAGVATLLLLPASSALALLLFVWWKRCQLAAALTSGAGLLALRASVAVPILAAVACLSLHATLGFAGAGPPAAQAVQTIASITTRVSLPLSLVLLGAVQIIASIITRLSLSLVLLGVTLVEYQAGLASIRIKAVQTIASIITRLSLSLVLLGVTLVEYQAGLASIRMNLARAVLCTASIGAFVASAVIWSISACPRSHVTFPERATPPAFVASAVIWSISACPRSHVTAFAASAVIWSISACPRSHVTFPERATPACGADICCVSLQASDACVAGDTPAVCEVAAVVELAAILFALLHLATLAASFGTTRCILVVRDTCFREGAGAVPLGLDPSCSWAGLDNTADDPLSPESATSPGMLSGSGWGTPSALGGAG